MAVWKRITRVIRNKQGSSEVKFLVIIAIFLSLMTIIYGEFLKSFTINHLKEIKALYQDTDLDQNTNHQDEEQNENQNKDQDEDQNTNSNIERSLKYPPPSLPPLRPMRIH